MDCSGGIDFAEWRAATSKITDSRLISAFEFFDRDHSGSISISEIKNAIGATDYGAFNEELWGDLIKEFDKDGSGSIDF